MSFPEELRAGEGVDLYYTLHLHPKIYRIVCLVFVSALVELTKSLSAKPCCLPPRSPGPIKVRQQPLAPSKPSIGSLIQSALIPPSSSSNCLLLLHIPPPDIFSSLGIFADNVLTGDEPRWQCRKTFSPLRSFGTR